MRNEPLSLLSTKRRRNFDKQQHKQPIAIHPCWNGKRNTQKTYGNDKVSNSVPKKINIDKFCEPMATLFNHMTKNSYMTKLWKETIVIPLPKLNKNNRNVSNHRPMIALYLYFQNWDFDDHLPNVITTVNSDLHVVMSL